MDHGVEQRLAGVVGLVGDDVSDLCADGCQVGLGEGVGRFFEVEVEVGLAGAQGLRLVLERAEAGFDLGVVVVEGAAFEDGEVAVDGGGVVFELLLHCGELFAFGG
ncbi:hypothetical protein [Paractinoplanes tereljensis]|uniref:hypothetical protein n=1 Tax=Paractinoplanes tereljensis TaxID=571912 RepID=UPI001941EE6B|nr:hypothetical protein [Actinoplanes tereljensis]